jgi:hypothetical protein
MTGRRKKAGALDPKPLENSTGALVLERLAERALEGAPGAISLMERFEPNARRLGHGQLFDDYRAKRRKTWH